MPRLLYPPCSTLIICQSVYAIQALLNSLAPLVGAESSLGKAVSPGWADNASEEQLKEWRKKGLEMQDELVKLTQEVTAKEYGKLMRKASCICFSINHAHSTEATRIATRGFYRRISAC